MFETTVIVLYVLFCMWMGVNKAQFFMRMSGLWRLENRLRILIHYFLDGKPTADQLAYCFIGLYGAAFLTHVSLSLNPRLVELVFHNVQVALSFLLLLYLGSLACLVGSLSCRAANLVLRIGRALSRE